VKTSVADIKQAVSEGVSIVCATCSKYHEGKARRLATCTAVDDCGSPIIGDTFHEYDGPITDFLRFCFVCGRPGTKGVRVKDRRRIIGVCTAHVDYVVIMAPKVAAPGLHLPVAPPEGSRIIVSSEGHSVAEKLIPKPEKTLANAMAAMEAGTFKPDC